MIVLNISIIKIILKKIFAFVLGVMVGEILQNLAILSSFLALIVTNIFLVQTRIDNFTLPN